MKQLLNCGTVSASIDGGQRFDPSHMVAVNAIARHCNYYVNDLSKML